MHYSIRIRNSITKDNTPNVLGTFGTTEKQYKVHACTQNILAQQTLLVQQYTVHWVQPSTPKSTQYNEDKTIQYTVLVSTQYNEDKTIQYTVLLEYTVLTEQQYFSVHSTYRTTVLFSTQFNNTKQYKLFTEYIA